MTKEMQNSYNQPQFFYALRVSKESSRSSSAARHNILYYTVWYNRYNRAVSTLQYDARYTQSQSTGICFLKTFGWRVHSKHNK